MIRRPGLSRHFDLREPADEDLMALVADGPARAFELVFERHGGAAFSLAYRKCGGTEVEVARRDEAREVRGALDELPAEQRNVIELAHFGGFTQTEIAAMLSVPVGTVKGRMRLGLTRFGDPVDAVA